MCSPTLENFQSLKKTLFIINMYFGSQKNSFIIGDLENMEILKGKVTCMPTQREKSQCFLDFPQFYISN